MSEPTLQSLIEAAKAYEGLFVPALFQQWTSKVIDAAQIKPDQRVLDVACGTGVLARDINSRTQARVTGIDPNPGMIAVAKQLAPSIEWHEGAAESLPFPDQSFDAVVSQFGLMFFNDRLQAIREMFRVLHQEGHLVVAVWDSLENNPAYAQAVEILDEFGGRPAGDALRAPFVLGDREKLSTLFSEAGIPTAEIKTQKGTANFPSIRTMMEADLRGWLPVMGVNLNEDQISRILQEAEPVLKSYVTPSGTASFPVSAHIVTARKHDKKSLDFGGRII